MYHAFQVYTYRQVHTSVFFMTLRKNAKNDVRGDTYCTNETRRTRGIYRYIFCTHETAPKRVMCRYKDGGGKGRKKETSKTIIKKKREEGEIRTQVTWAPVYAMLQKKRFGGPTTPSSFPFLPLPVVVSSVSAIAVAPPPLNTSTRNKQKHDYNSRIQVLVRSLPCDPRCHFVPGFVHSCHQLFFAGVPHHGFVLIATQTQRKAGEKG